MNHTPLNSGKAGRTGCMTGSCTAGTGQPGKSVAVSLDQIEKRFDTYPSAGNEPFSIANADRVAHLIAPRLEKLLKFRSRNICSWFLAGRIEELRLERPDGLHLLVPFGRDIDNKVRVDPLTLYIVIQLLRTPSQLCLSLLISGFYFGQSRQKAGTVGQI